MAKAKGVNLRVHFKNVVEVAAAVRGMTLQRAKTYLGNVLEKVRLARLPLRRSLARLRAGFSPRPRTAPHLFHYVPPRLVSLFSSFARRARRSRSA